MTLGYLLNPALQLENADGKPLVSGFIRVYRHGTTEPISTYKDFSGDRNPTDIILNNKGMAVILVDPNYLYDVYCYDANGVEQWSRLNVGVYGGSGGDKNYYAVTSEDNSVSVTSTIDPSIDETIIDLSISDTLSHYKQLQTPVDQSYADYGFVKSLKQTANGNVTLECSYISAATESVTGLMSSSDKTKLDNIQSGAEVNQNAFSNVKVGNSTISASSKTDTVELAAGSHISITPDTANKKITIASDWPDLSGYKTKQTEINQPYADYAFIKTLTQTANGEVSIEASYISAATESVTGLMSSSDKTKLDGIYAGAQPNQNAFSNIKVGNDTVAADSTTDTVEFVAGANIALTPDTSNDSITISATNTTYSAGTGLTLSGTTFAVNTSTIQEKLTAGSNITISGTTISSTDTNTHRPIQVNGTQNLGDNVTPLNLKAGNNVTLTANGGEVTIAAASATAQVNADWTSNSGVSQILNKPSLQFKPYGGTAGDMTSLLLNADDPEGYVDVGVNGGSLGSLVAGPYAGLLNSGVNGVGDSSTPVYINSSGQFDTCSIPNAEFIQFNFSNTTTPQDDVYAAIAAAYTNGKLPVLTCTVAGGALYWVPTATGQTGYAFSRNTSTTCFTAEFDHTLHILTLAQKSIVDYTAGTNVAIDSNNVISATDTTYTAGSFININGNNVISNTMHQDTVGLMISYNTLANAGVTTHSWGPWRLQITKRAMATWDDGTGMNPSIYVQVAHSDYISGTITHGRIQHVNYYPWRDGVMDQVFTGHVQWPFDGSYTQGGSNNGFAIDLTSPMDPDGYARACPRSMRAVHLIYNCGIDSPDWLDLNIEPLYVTNNTSISTNAARLLIRAKYFYV